jgi:hypothetical protein
LWYSALHEKLGIFVKTPDPTRLKTLLYNERKRINDPALHSLIIRTAPNNVQSEFWIVKVSDKEKSNG